MITVDLSRSSPVTSKSVELPKQVKSHVQIVNNSENDEIMDTANTIVFRPLFSYRQTQSKKKEAARRNSSRRRSAAQRRKSPPRRNGYYQNQSVKRYNTRPSYTKTNYYPRYYQNAQFPTLA